MFTKSDPLSRRTLLRGLGVSMALPWLESLSFAAGGRSSATDQPPTRTLVTFTGMGFTRITGGPKARAPAWNSARA